MRAASLNTWGPWKKKARSALQELAASGNQFTSDRLYELVGPPTASSKNAVGALFREFSQAGKIVPVGARPSKRPQAHGRLVRIWVGARGGGGDA